MGKRERERKRGRDKETEYPIARDELAWRHQCKKGERGDSSEVSKEKEQCHSELGLMGTTVLFSPPHMMERLSNKGMEGGS